MPAQTANSAEKSRAAQAARRQAAQRSAAERRSRPTPSAPVVAAAQARPAPASALAASAQPVTLDATDAEGCAEAVAELDMICDLVETNPGALGQDANSIRQICRNRRQALANKGKAAMSGKRRTASRASVAASFLNGDADGREMSRKHRQQMASKGRGNSKPSRPSGRIRPHTAPPKVETGTTLSGSPVTGTQVERKSRVTGNEPGTCRTITGTEYIGSEQFTAFCGSKPAPNQPAKVGVSVTSGGMHVSGTELGRSARVTGDEQGACRSVTGTEYLGAERFAEFCENKGLAGKPPKVMSSMSERKHIGVTGADEARANRTTGAEAGAQRSITGSQYADTGAAKLTINGPAKVALTHTIAGRPVTGTEVGRSSRVTGDEQGSCRSITGTEYISNEQFASICQTVPQPGPAKVGVDRTRRDQRITGNLVDRSDKVTGNEPGSCKRVTGAQYDSASNKLCGGAPPKAHTMHTLAGRELTGTRVDHSPKLSGDEHGGCLSVTGDEYYGQEQFAGYCASTPSTEAHAHTHEPEHHGACCSACAAKQLAEAVGLIAPQAYYPQPPVAPQPAPMMMAQPPYPVYAAQPQPEPTAPTDFSIVSPARAAQKRGSQSAITGNSYDGNSRVTGPVNLGGQWVSGTPEFRHTHMTQPQQVMVQPQPAAPAPMQVPATAPTPVPVSLQQPVAEGKAPAQRITGEGRDGGISITGDNWARGRQITGTEGRSAQGRNPTLRCEARGAAFNAHVNRNMERPAAPPASAITGSSGNTHQGAVITVSGGARG